MKYSHDFFLRMGGSCSWDTTRLFGNFSTNYNSFLLTNWEANEGKNKQANIPQVLQLLDNVTLMNGRIHKINTQII